MTPASQNGEDLVNCPKCLSEYDEVERIPKFLFCYHTVCLRCILEMKQTTKVSCPTCPKMRRVDENFDGHSLVSNTHALYLVRKMKEQIKPTDTNKMAKEENSTTLLSTEQINGSTLTQCQTLLALKSLYFKKKINYLEKLEAAAGVRQQLKAYLAEISEALKSITSQIKSLEEENEFLLHKMTFELENSRKLFTDGSQDEENEFFLALFYKLITPSELAEDSYDILSAKLNEYFNEEKIKLELDAESLIHKQGESINKTKLLIKLFSDENDLNSRPFEINSFTAKWKEWTASSNSILTQKQRDQLLLSYLILSLKVEQKESACSPEETVAVVSSSSAAEQPFFLPPSITPSSKSGSELSTAPNSVKDKSILFTITVTKIDENLKDSIHIIPSLAGQSFIQEIGKGIHLLYYRKAKVLRNVGKPELVTIPLKLSELQLVNMPSTFIQESLDLKPRDVYLVKEKEAGGNQQAPTWCLCFVLKESTIPLPQAVYFGMVEKGLSAISNFAKADDRSSYTFSVIEGNK